MEIVIQVAERLFVPHRKRLSHAYVLNDQGARELRIYYGIKEIVFDDERYFAFGEQLVTEPSFTGQHATTWGPGYEWDELRPLLEEGSSSAARVPTIRAVVVSYRRPCLRRCARPRAGGRSPSASRSHRSSRIARSSSASWKR